jgi:enolase
VNDTIVRVKGREVLDSRGRPTVEAEVWCAGGAVGRAIVPAGASTGRTEARELRDGDPRRFGGLGVRRAVAHVDTVIGPAVRGLAASDQAVLDQRLVALDGTPTRERLGANALLAVSLAAAHAAAAARGRPLFAHIADLMGETEGRTLPLPMINVLSGGLHAAGAVDFQDYLVVPVGAPDYAAAIEMTAAVIADVRAELERRGAPLGLADEGGYGPPLPDNEAGLALLVEAITRAGYEPGRDVSLALDVAASHFFRDGRYHLRREGRVLSSAEMVAYLVDLCRRWPIVSLEDGLAEEDWDGWTALTTALAPDLQVLGDDLFTTHADRLARGADQGAANAVLIKMNQVGTLSETLATMRLARARGYRCVVSARSGETEDTTLADLAVGTDAGQIKIGSLQRSSRLAKYNQLFRIADALGERACWAGAGALAKGRGRPN